MVIPALTLIAALLVPQAVAEIDKESDTVALAFDHPLKAIDGSDVVLDRAEFRFVLNPPPGAPIPGPVLVLRDMQPIVMGENLYAVKDLFTSVPPGEYDVTVRVRSTLGAWSESSPVLHRKIVSKKPVAPTALRESAVGN